MRLIRSKIYRAFPELDTFNDEQCRRFVVAANSSWGRRVARWIGVGAGSVGVGVGALLLVGAVDMWLRPGPRVSPTEESAITVVFLVVCLGSIVLPCLCALVFRDMLLRLTIRRVIRRCGTCPACRYSLLGIRMGPENTITCPECGMKVVADPAMGELTTDETGAAVYKPEVARLGAVAIERRRRRPGALVKYAALAVGAAAILLATGVGGWWAFLTAQARRATGERNTVARVRALQEAMWPGTRDAGVFADEEFERYRALVTAANATTRMMVPVAGAEPGGIAGDGEPGGDGSVAGAGSDQKMWQSPPFPVSFEPLTLRDDEDAAAFDKRNAVAGSTGEGAFAACRAYTMRGVEKARADKLPERLREIMHLQGPVRVMAPPPTQPFILTTVTDLSESRGLARLNLARMNLAFKDRDPAEYADAAEETLAAAEIVERQGLLIDRLVATAMRSTVYKRFGDDAAKLPSADWLERAMGVMERRGGMGGAGGGVGVGVGGRLPLAANLEVERVAGLDTIQWFFGDPWRVAKSQCGAPDQTLFSSTWGGMQGSVGTYEANKAGWNAMYAAYSAAGSVADATKRPALPSAPTGLAMIDMLAPALGSVLRSEDQLLYEQRRCLVSLGAALYRVKNGKPPGSPAEVAALLKDPLAIVDPVSGKPFQFIVKDEPGMDGKRFEIRDGDPDEVKPWEPKPFVPRNVRRPPQKSVDGK